MALTIDQLEIQIVAETTSATQALDILISKLKTVQSRCNGLGTAGKNAGKGLKETASGATKVNNAIDKQGKIYDKATKSSKSFTDKLANQISKYRTLYGAFKSAANMMAGWFKESNEYIETLNLFNITMGDAAESAREYAQAVEKAMGIDSKDFMQYQGVFKNLTAGFGVSAKQANIMSQNLTQLSYDMASFFDATTVEESFDKLSSAMSGQVKGLREYGIDTTVATLQEYALSKGIQTKVRNMTQAEKALLRYNYIMEQSTHIQGDMARTLITPSNSMRILSAQMTRMKRALGNIVSVIATKFIPYVQAMTEMITEAASAIAKYFGFSEKDFAADTSGIVNSWGDAEEGVEDYADALKAAKKQMMGFDELNIIGNPESSNSSGESLSSGLGNLQPLEYNFLGDLNNDLDEAKEKIKDIAQWVGVVAAGFAGWKISSKLFGVGAAGTGLLSAISSGEGIKEAALALATKFKKAFGVGLMASGAALDISVAVDSWTDGVSWEGLVEQLEGAGLLHLGGFLVGGLPGLGIGAAIDGVLSLLPSVKSAVADGNKEWSNTLSIIKGIATLFGGISVLTGNWIPIAIGGVITVVSVIAIYFEDIVNWFKSLPQVIGNFFVNLWDGIKNLWSTVANWFNNSVITPIVNFFKGLWLSVAGFFVGLWEGIKNIWVSAGTWFNESVIQPIVNFFAPIVEWISTFFYGCWLIIQAVWITVCNWFDEHVITPIVEGFKQLWEGIKETWNKVTTWFDENIIQPLVESFKLVWEKVSGFFVDLWESIKTVWSMVASWFDEHIIAPLVNGFKLVWEKVSGFFTKLWGDIKAVWSIVSNWFNEKIIEPIKKAWSLACEAISGFFSKLWSGIKKGVVDAMNGVIGAIESAINWVIRAINKLIKGFNGVVEWAADVVGAEWGGLGTIPEVTFKRISYFAMGGFPDVGEMFIAREAGPELVGNIGRKTAVANNDQIISGIENGVYRAMVAANSTNNSGGTQTIRIINEIDGDVVGEKVIRYHNNKVMQTGASPLLV